MRVLGAAVIIAVLLAADPPLYISIPFAVLMALGCGMIDRGRSQRGEP